MRTVRAFAVMVLVCAMGGVWLGAADAVEPGPVLPYGAGGYRYQQVATGGGPPTFSDVGFDDSGFALGTAPFGHVVPAFGCSLEPVTSWSPNTDLLVRRVLSLPGGTTDVVVHIAIDNDIELFWNGTPIGSFQHGGCASYDSVEVAVPAALLAAGDNVLAARASDRGGETFLDIEVTANLPPDCTTVSTDLTTLWPPNHSFRTVTVVGGVDPEGQHLDLSILSVTQDEPLDGAGDATTVPDADKDGLPADQVRLRAERSGGGDGRVYRIGVSATDPSGSSCSTTITVGVPHDQRGQHGAVDTTAVVVDSFGPAPSLLTSTSGGQSLPVADHRPSIEHDEDGTTPAQSTLIPEVGEAAVPVETQPTEPPATEPAPSGPSPAPVSPLPDVPTAPESDPDPPGPGKDHRGSTMRERRDLPASAANSSR